MLSIQGGGKNNLEKLKVVNQALWLKKKIILGDSMIKMLMTLKFQSN